MTTREIMASLSRDIDIPVELEDVITNARETCTSVKEIETGMILLFFVDIQLHAGCNDAGSI